MIPQYNTYDELNIAVPESSKRSIPFERYFGEMGLSDRQKDERISAAEDMKDEILQVLMLIFFIAQQNIDAVDWLMIEGRFNTAIETALLKHFPDNHISSEKINKVAKELTDTTFQHVVPHPRDDTSTVSVVNRSSASDDANIKDTYYLSEDRAMFIAEEETNSFGNFDDFLDAIEDGMTQKTWNTMADNKVRKTHRPLEGKTIGILEKFQVGDSEMLYPRDDEGSEEETIGCRCWLTFS